MSKDGVAFVVLVILVSWIAGALAAVLISLLLFVGSLVAVPVVLVWTVDWLRSRNINIPASIDIKAATSYRIGGTVLPSEFILIERQILDAVGIATDGYVDVVYRFLSLVGAYDKDETALPCMQNGIALKLMYEYRRKYGNLDYEFTSRNMLDITDALRRLDANERQDFQLFCTSVAN